MFAKQDIFVKLKLLENSALSLKISKSTQLLDLNFNHAHGP
jgi:hypothetical protein